jgi:hypothetical protein
MSEEHDSATGMVSGGARMRVGGPGHLSNKPTSIGAAGAIYRGVDDHYRNHGHSGACRRCCRVE